MFQSTGFAEMQKQMAQQMQNLGANQPGAQTMGGSLNQTQLNKLLNDNEQLRTMVE